MFYFNSLKIVIIPKDIDETVTKKQPTVKGTSQVSNKQLPDSLYNYPISLFSLSNGMTI